MQGKDSLLHLLVDFFDLPPDTRPENVAQPAVAGWDSLASVQLVTELQSAYHVDFELDEIEALRSYDQIRYALSRKGVSLDEPEAA